MINKLALVILVCIVGSVQATKSNPSTRLAKVASANAQALPNSSDDYLKFAARLANYTPKQLGVKSITTNNKTVTTIENELNVINTLPTDQQPQACKNLLETVCDRYVTFDDASARKIASLPEGELKDAALSIVNKKINVPAVQPQAVQSLDVAQKNVVVEVAQQPELKQCDIPVSNEPWGGIFAFVKRMVTACSVYMLRAQIDSTAFNPFAALTKAGALTTTLKLINRQSAANQSEGLENKTLLDGSVSAQTGLNVVDANNQMPKAQI